MDNFDICIVGNGSVGIMTAVELSKSLPNKEIALIGPFSQKGSASVAAGAMHAVFGEIESHIDHSDGDQQQFKLALASKDIWKEHFDFFGESSKTANDTIIYLKDTKNPFEVNNFKKATQMANDHEILRSASEDEVNNYLNIDVKDIEDVKVLKGEFSFCPVTLFKQALDFLENASNVSLINDVVISIDGKVAKIGNDISIKSDKFIVSNGAAAYDLLKEHEILPVYQGVGTAMIINSDTISYGSEFVVRTVNRGGAQCGVHVVPRADGTHYIGAGNYLAEFDSREDHRLETVRYLTNVAESDIIGQSDAYNMRGKLVLGKRPRSFDGWPLFGPLRSNNNIIVASGWNRVGFTLSPLIAKEILSILKTENTRLINNWLPDRDPISFGSGDECAEFFASSRCANLIEHNLLEPGTKSYDLKHKELRELSFLKNSQITTNLNLSKDFGIHPDLYGLLS